MTRRQKSASLWIASGWVALAVLYNFAPTEYSIYPRCPFYSITHLLCPGCGGTRAIYELVHMNLQAALHYNALVSLLTPMALLWLVWCSYQVFRYDRWPRVPWPRTLALTLGVIALSFAIVRDIGIAFVI